MNKDFNINQYINYQKELKNKFDLNEINFYEYMEQSSLYLEKKEFYSKIQEIEDWIKFKNLPFVIEYNTYNIWALLEASDKLTPTFNNFFSK